MKYLISTILTHKQEKHSGSYSMLNMGFLKNIVPRADEYLNFLKNEGVIDWVNYSAGRNSRLYRLTKQFEGKTFYRTLTDHYLIRRIQNNSKRMKYCNSKKYPILNLYVQKVQIDTQEAQQTIEKTYQDGINSQSIEKREKAEARRTYSLGEILKIESGEIYKRVSKTNGRYDSNFTRLPSELVQHLSIDGHPLTEIDIANSQPFFVVSLFNPTQGIQKIMKMSLPKPIYEQILSLQLLDKQDIIKYIYLVLTGKFYKFMMSEFRNNGLKFIDYDNIKEQLFAVFFDKNSAKLYSPAVKLFASLFPNVQLIFEIIKSDQHNRLAILLQKIESYTMLDCVVPKIISNYPGLPFITKHDSILPSGVMVTGKAEEIKKLISREIKRVIGFEPKLKNKGDNKYNHLTTQTNKQSIIISYPLSIMYTDSVQLSDNQ
jgi:hypothetical protein